MTDRPVAIVTAASRGMGAAIARRLASSHRVALMSRSDEVTAVAAELSGIARVGSVDDAGDTARLVEATLAAYGRIDAVVCNTGHPPKGDLLEVTDDDWHAALDLVLLNVVRMARLVAPVMERQGGGAIVNISAFGAVEPSLAFPVSSTLRAGLSAFTKLFADRYGPAGIRMNNVLPGFIETYGVDDETRGRIPLGRPGTVDEVAALVEFLVSAGAGYVTGQSIVADGGITRSF